MPKERKTSSKNIGLGKGLSALISTESNNTLQAKGYIPELPIEQISPNPHQPRMNIKPEELVDIADSIRENGIIQPLIVTKRGDQDYVLIAGERRWRASQLAGLTTLPVVIKDVSPQQMLELAVIENVQRKDLNSIEEALAFKQLRERFSMSPTEIGKKLGMARVTVTNKIRLLNLPQDVKQLVLDEKITEGHARALLGLVDPDSIIITAHTVIKKNLSVHDTEDLVRRLVQGQNTKELKPLDEKSLQIEKNLNKHFDGALVSIRKLKGGGKITIRYRGDSELEDIFNKIVAK